MQIGSPISSIRATTSRITFGGKYPLATGSVNLLLKGIQQRNGIIQNSEKLSTLEDPTGMVIDNQADLKDALALLKIPAKDYANIDFKSSVLLLALQQTNGQADPIPPQKTVKEISKQSLWGKTEVAPKESSPELMQFNKLFYHRKDDVLIAEVTPLPYGEKVAWALIHINNAKAYTQDDEKTVALIKIDKKTTFNVSPE